MCNKVEIPVENIEKNIGIEKDKELVGNTSTNKITHLGKSRCHSSTTKYIQQI